MILRRREAERLAFGKHTTVHWTTPASMSGSKYNSTQGGSSPRYHSDHSDLRQWDTKDHSVTPGTLIPVTPITIPDDEVLTTRHWPLSSALYLSSVPPQDIPHNRAHTGDVLTIGGSEHNWELLSVRGCQCCMTCVTSTRRISGLQQSEQCDGSTQRPEELRTPTARSGISTTKSTFSRSICICNWFIHSMVSSVPFRIMLKCCHEHLMNNVFGSSFFVPLHEYQG